MTCRRSADSDVCKTGCAIVERDSCQNYVPIRERDRPASHRSALRDDLDLGGESNGLTEGGSLRLHRQQGAGDKRALFVGAAAVGAAAGGGVSGFAGDDGGVDEVGFDPVVDVGGPDALAVTLKVAVFTGARSRH